MALETLQELMRRSGVGGRLVLPNPDSAVVRRPNPSAASKEVVDRALALSWTLRDEGGYALFHVTVLKGRVQMELDGQCDVESRRRVIRLVNRALTTLEWPSLTESLPNWVTFFELSAQLIALGGRDEGLAIWSRQLEGIEARATPTRAASTLLTFCKLLVEKALDGAEKMDDDDYVRDPNVLSAETKATLARAAALLSAATSEVGGKWWKSYLFARMPSHFMYSPRLGSSESHLSQPSLSRGHKPAFCTGIRDTGIIDYEAARLSGQGYWGALCQTPPRAIAAGQEGNFVLLPGRLSSWRLPASRGG